MFVGGCVRFLTFLVVCEKIYVSRSKC